MRLKTFKSSILVLLVPLLFLIISIFTLSDYGINWDAPKHFIRGQSYLHFILTGKRDFLDVPAYSNLKGAPDYVDFNVYGASNSAEASLMDRIIKDPNVRRSYFQSDFYTFDYFMTKHIHTHPEVNNLLLAFSNFIFYQKLGIMGDIEAYHLYIVVTVFFLISGIALWVNRNFGLFPSIVATSSLSLYPLVFAETHFNFKDPVLMSFFGLTILTFWYGITKTQYYLIIISSIFAGFALGTKFNAIFLGPILFFWLVFFLLNKYKMQNKKNLIKLIGGWKMLLSLLLYPLIPLLILFILSPYLWVDPIGHFFEIINYYKDIGTETADLPSEYLLNGFNILSVIWILTTTPLPILCLSLIGIFYTSILLVRQKSELSLLILLWFFTPILRVVWPGTNIYGGIRQIMEFIPALAILSGIGAYVLLSFFSKFHPIIKYVILALITLSLVFVTYELKSIHPNQNIYFNQLIGGLSGAKSRNIPSWGNSFGNAYLQGINWLNENAQQDAKLALAVNYISSIPRLKLRSDIDLNNAHFSGLKREGEYAMELSYDWPLKYRYKYSYYDTFLEPVYQVKIDEVLILKIWKNDLKHTKPDYRKEVVIKPSRIEVLENNNPNSSKKLKIDFEKKILITRLIIDHEVNDCQIQSDTGFIMTSLNENDWLRDLNPLFDPESPEQYLERDKDTFVFMFAGKPVQSIILNSELANPCIFKDYQVTVMRLENSLGL